MAETISPEGKDSFVSTQRTSHPTQANTAQHCYQCNN
jgi:hypothetical protein